MEFVSGIVTGVIASWFVSSIKSDKTEIEQKKRDDRDLENPEE